MASPDLSFAPISLYPAGTLADIIGRSYAELLEKWPDGWKDEPPKWADLDHAAFAFPDSVGRCFFISSLGAETVGMASYDPRPGPAYGAVGQNCVLPEFRGRGFGKLQILEVLRRLRDRGMKAARVTTSSHPFFAPALRMYRSLGFKDIRRRYGGPDPRYRLIELEIALGGRSEPDR
jgi:ribosomal protein S18 acetylase RimI-like enzyme